MKHLSQSKPIIITITNTNRYIESTGIMFEFAPEFGANIIFIEHR